MSTLPSERDWEAEFAEITAHLDAVDEAAATSGFPHVWRAPQTVVRPEESSVRPDEQMLIGDDCREDTPPDATRAVSTPGQVTHADEIDTFVPPAPAAMDRDDPATVIMIGSLVVGPLWLLYLTLAAPETVSLWWVLAGLTTALGFVLAVARQPRSRDEGDLDDGARV